MRPIFLFATPAKTIIQFVGGIFVFGGTIVGCATAPQQSAPQSAVYRQGNAQTAPSQPTFTPGVKPPPQTAAPAASPVYIRPPETNTAAMSLLRDANTALAQNDLAKAVVAAERAQRVAPRDPSVYLTLSRVRCAQASYGQCEQLARKALSLQPSLSQRDEAQQLIIRAKTAE